MQVQEYTIQKIYIFIKLCDGHGAVTYSKNTQTS